MHGDSCQATAGISGEAILEELNVRVSSMKGQKVTLATTFLIPLRK